jgi:heme O synthase-like polyprenyltransferase
VQYNCNKCESSNTQKISAIVSGGTTHGNSTSNATTVGIVDCGLAVAGTRGSTNTTMKTELAKKLAMPTKRTESWMFYGVFIGGGFAWIGGAIVGFLGVMIFNSAIGAIAALLAVLLIFIHCVKHYRNCAKRNEKYNTVEYPNEKAQWDLGFYCHRCENVFIPKLR